MMLKPRLFAASWVSSRMLEDDVGEKHATSAGDNVGENTQHWREQALPMHHIIHDLSR